MNIFNKKFISILIFVLLLPYIFKNELREFFEDKQIPESESIVDEEIEVENTFEIKNNDFDNPEFNKQLAPTMNYLSKYETEITDKANIVKNSLDNLVKSRNDVKLFNKPMTSFDSLNFNRAFIDTLKIQSLDDKYIYKLNQRL